MRINCVLGPFLPVPPYMGGAVERVWQNLCAEFSNQGHQVNLISRQYKDLALSENCDGVSYIRVKSFDGPKSKILYRILDLIYALRICVMLPKADVTVTNSVSLPFIIPRGRAGKIYMSVARFPKGQMALYRRVDRIQCVSSHVAQAVIAQSPSVAELVCTIPNAIGSGFADAIDDHRGSREKTVLFVGRVAKEKSVETLIRAFARVSRQFPDWQLSIVGPHQTALGGDGDDYLRELQTLGASLGAAVTFAGPIFDEASLISRLKTSEIFVYPSIAAKGEALPLAPLEAMACGCAVIVSSLDCFTDYIEDGRTGLTFDHNDTDGDALADQLERLMRDRPLREKLGLAATQTARHFTRSVVARKYLEDFQALTEPA